MTKIYNELLDHTCPGAREWSNKGNLYFEGWACWCSPLERNYRFDWGGKTYRVVYCPACGKVMNPYRDRILPIYPLMLSLRDSIVDL